jgi:hypothetical protein
MQFFFSIRCHGCYRVPWSVEFVAPRPTPPVSVRDDGEGQNRPRAGKGGTERSRADGTDAPRGTGTGERGGGPTTTHPRNVASPPRVHSVPASRAPTPLLRLRLSSPTPSPLLSPAPLPASPAPSVGGWGVAWWWLPCLPSSSSSSGDGARAPALLSPPPSLPPW